MVVLGMDTATADAVVGVARGGEILRDAALEPDADGRPRHSRVLLAEVERCAEAAGGWSAVDRIAVGTGPGSYTGVRIGISCGLGLSLAKGVPLAGMPSVCALGEAGGYWVIGDARRGKFFRCRVEDGRMTGAPVLSVLSFQAELL